MNVTPGYTYTSATDSATHTKANLQSTPTVSLGANEIALTNLPTAAQNNTFLARSTTGSGNYEALVTTTTGLGYYVGAGGTVTQITSKSTAVTLSKVTGVITMEAGALAAGTIVSFALANARIVATDYLAINHAAGGTQGAYTVTYSASAGSATIYVRNNTASSLAEAISLRFVLLKSVDT